MSQNTPIYHTEKIGVSYLIDTKLKGQSFGSFLAFDTHSDIYYHTITFRKDITYSNFAFSFAI